MKLEVHSHNGGEREPDRRPDRRRAQRRARGVRRPPPPPLGLRPPRRDRRHLARRPRGMRWRRPALARRRGRALLSERDTGPVIALSPDLGETVGWPAFARTVARVYPHGTRAAI